MKMTNSLEDLKINVKLKLSLLWVTVMFLFLYVDVFANYIPGRLEDLIAGELAGIPITQVFLLVFMILMTIPSLMVFLSIALKAKANRWTNIIVGIFQIGLVLVSIIGDPNYFYMFGSSVEFVLLLLIVWYAWKWPTQEG
jgi:hypothetical protein